MANQMIATNPAVYDIRPNYQDFPSFLPITHMPTKSEMLSCQNAHSATAKQS